jgi:hypothetical protein
VRIWWNWQTRYFEVVVPQGVQVQVLLCAPIFTREIEGFIDSNTDFSALVGLFYTRPVVNIEMLVVMLEKHDIATTQNFMEATAPDDGDLSRPAQVFVPEADYDRAYQLFYAEREDEL